MANTSSWNSARNFTVSPQKTGSARATPRDLAIDMEPAPQAENEAIVRRLSLDITGRIPTPETVANYLRSKREDKLTRYIDHLLA